MFDRLKALLSKTKSGNDVSSTWLEPSGEDDAASSVLHEFAESKIRHWLTQSGYSELIARLELAHEEAGRVLYQALPIRIYVYDLDSARGAFEFEHAFYGERPDNTLIEAATVRQSDKKLGYFLYSLAPLPNIPSLSDRFPALESYCVLDDWQRLLDYAKSHDVAYGILWLRKLYGEAAITLTEILARERQLDRDFAEAMTYLNDSTLHEWLGRLKEKLAGREGADVFGKMVDGYIEMSTKGRERKKPLRENPLIAALFALQSPIFYSINLESFKELCLSSFERLQISDSDIELCNDFFNYITKHDAEGARELAQISYCAAKAAGGKELIAYAGGNMAVVLAPSDKPEDLRLAIQHLRESRSLFSSLNAQHTALGAIEINLKRFTGRLAKVGQSDEPVQPESRPEDALKTYNERIRARDFAGARQSLDTALEKVNKDQPLWMDLNALAGQTLLGDDRIDEAYKRLYRLQNAVAEGSSSSSGHYEAFHAALLLRSGDTKGAIEIAADAIKRLAHVCPLEVLSILTVTLSAAYTESGDADAAIALIKKYEYAVESRENRLFLRANLVFCPTSWITNLPLHALTVDGEKCIADFYRCIYNASATMYALSATRTRARNNSGFAIIDPRSEMFYANEEAAILSGNSTIKFNSIVRGPLTWDQLKDSAADAYWIHVSAHGYQDSRHLSLLSGLETGPRTEDTESPENLTALSAFVEYFPDLGTSVVVLSSCYAGEVSSLADEPVGVTTALLTGGAKAVIAPMWKVDEFSTVVFMEHFYERLKEVKTVAEAIQRAQILLRKLTTSELLQKLDAILAKSVSSKRKVESYRDFLAKNFAVSDFPYSDPYYWSAFSLIGCNVKLT